MEKIFLVGVHWKGDSRKQKSCLASLDELERLVDTAGGQAVGRILQTLEHPNPATLIGKGRVAELRNRAKAGEFTTLVFDEDLKPAQQKNLSELIPAKVLDRTRLILDIFARRARSREGILQVELAQLSYHLPRMTERYGRFEQQVGGIGTRGPGERKLEVEERHIRDRIALLKREIESIKLHREIARERRHRVPLPTVAIVGYTNAGKSTLLNKLVQLYGQSPEPLYADDKLFATLDPTTRRIRLPSGRWALFTDTVGFIDKLPHAVIAAFRSTLEEALDADLLVHLIDVSDENWMEHSKTVIETLDSLEHKGKNSEGPKKVLTAFNKVDLLSEPEKLQILPSRTGPSVLLSATKGSGVHALLQGIENKLTEEMIERDLILPFKRADMLESLYRLGRVESVSHESRGIHLHVRLEKSHWGKLQKLLESGRRT